MGSGVEVLGLFWCEASMVSLLSETSLIGDGSHSDFCPLVSSEFDSITSAEIW